MNAADADAYLSRIGAVRPAGPDLGALQDLQLRHLQAVPFENLTIHLGEPIVLEEQALLDKLVGRRRGGFCYELNGAFAALLSSLGFSVTLLAGRVFGEGGLGPPFAHLALRVDLSEPWLVDVGFGAFSLRPLRLDDRSDQLDPAGTFRIAEKDHGDLEVLEGGRARYRLERRPRLLGDFEATCWWHQTSPKSHFTWSPVCSLPTHAGRITLSGRTLVRTLDGERQEQVLAGDDAVIDAYRRYFGISLDRVPAAPTG